MESTHQTHAAPTVTGPVGVADRGVIQRTRWQWSATHGRWSPHAGSEITSEAPSFPGHWDGQVYDDQVEPPKRLEFGAGNFSFAQSYTQKHPTFAPQFTTSSYESRQELNTTYAPQRALIGKNIQSLQQRGATVQHGVDATTAHAGNDVTHFNFPHTGDIHRKKTSVMLKGFLDEAEKANPEGHLIRMGLLKEGFDSRYGLRGALKDRHYHPIRKKQFTESRFPGYQHVKTTGKGDFDFSDKTRDELWLEKRKVPVTSMNAITDLETDEDSNSDEERELVHRAKRRRASYARTHPYDYHMRRFLEERPNLRMDRVTLTDNPHTGAYRTFSGATVKPTGRFMGQHIEVSVESSDDHRLPVGTTAYAKRRHLMKMGR